MTHKTAMIGSNTFPLGTAVGSEIVDEIRALGRGTVILTRGSGDCEQFIAIAALALGVRCFEFKGEGGALNFVRDAELVAACDELIAFLDPAILDAPYTGTKGVIERALNAQKPVRVATIAEGGLVWESS